MKIYKGYEEFVRSIRTKQRTTNEGWLKDFSWCFFVSITYATQLRIFHHIEQISKQIKGTKTALNSTFSFILLESFLLFRFI